MSFTFLRPAFLLGAFSFMACQEVNLDRRTTLLVDSNGDGYASSGACGIEPAFEGCGDVEDPTATDDCVIFPNPGDCPLLQWSEEYTVVVDENGNVIEETYTTCTQCLDAAGNPIGEEECTTGGGTDPVVCYTVESGDPTLSCWECSSPDGELLYGGCDPIPVYCESDAECPSGQVCEIFPTWECDPNAEVCALSPDFIAGGVCVVPVQGCFSDDDCNAGETCQFTDWKCPPDMACPAVAQGTCVADNTCLSDADCNPGEVCGLWEPFPCEDGEVCIDIVQGVCLPGVGGCDTLGDEQSCSASGCEWAVDPTTGCLGGPNGEGCPGFCTNPQPGDVCYDDSECGVDEYCQFQAWDCPEGMGCPAVLTGTCEPLPPVDGCETITDEQACGATEGCGWFYFGMPCIEGEPCISGVCQTVDGGCGTDILPAP